ncbi:MAG: HK97 family phage prohead protease [Prevotella sp.]|nr:HK97 family phage prohead protease [Prevotella sp.]
MNEKKKTTTLFTPATMQVREIVREDGTKEPSRTICGRAIVFNKPFEYEDWWGDKYREIIAPESCKKEWLDTQDIKLNLLHNREASIARSNCTQGNLRYSVNEEGVNFEFEAPKCDLGDRALELVRSGVYTGCSFEFYPKDYEYKKNEADGQVTYEITHKAFEKLTAFTIAMDPAYKETNVDCREHYAPTAAPAAATSDSAPVPGASASSSAAAVADDADAAAREKSRISQAREIAALRRELSHEIEINSLNV